jgi:hypothetical protein
VELDPLEGRWIREVGQQLRLLLLPKVPLELRIEAQLGGTGRTVRNGGRGGRSLTVVVHGRRKRRR